MHFLRSKLFVALVALLVWGGYAETVFGICEAAGEQQHEQFCGSKGSGSAHHDDCCQCLCHQAVPHVPSAALPMAEPATASAMLVEWADFAPEGVALAIDHPPQLG